MISYLLLALVDVLVKMALDKTVRKVLPRIFAEVDKLIPAAMEANATPAIIEKIIVDTIQKEAKIVPTKTDVDAVIRLYSPVEAAKSIGGAALKGLINDLL